MAQAHNSFFPNGLLQNTDVTELIEPLYADLITFRRDVHQNPEVSWEEYQTTQKIITQLQDAGLDPQPLKDGRGAYVDIGTGPIVAGFRADIDALPLEETTELPYSAHGQGAHACGHDIHTSVMLGTALALAKAHKEKPFHHTIRVIFQPAEEKMPGGALSVISQGVLEGVPQIFALHADPQVDVGTIGTRVGAITSASDVLKIKLTGKGGHTSRPHLTQDLVFALSKIATEVPAVLSRRFDPRSGVSVVWGHINAGDAPNAIPSEGSLSGTLRCLDDKAWHDAGEIIETVINDVGHSYGVEVNFEHVRGVPPVTNTKEGTAAVERSAVQELGEGKIHGAPQSMGGEDFGWMLQEVPGAFFRLGTKSPGGTVYDLHRSDYSPNEDALAVGTAIMTRTALNAVRNDDKRT